MEHPTIQTQKPTLISRLSSPKVAGYVFVAPFIIYFLIFFLYPICETFYTSLRQ